MVLLVNFALTIEVDFSNERLTRIRLSVHTGVHVSNECNTPVRLMTAIRRNKINTMNSN